MSWFGNCRVVDVVQWRKSHVLCWMIEKSIVNPSALALGHRDVISSKESWEVEQYRFP
jgi:hypothetical protein